MTTIKRLLVANRGEIVSRVIRSAHDLNIEVVAIYSESDRELPSIAEADHAIALPGNHPTETYLNSEAIIAAATRSGADAIHPGYGFLSESAQFAQAVIDAGLTFLGPSPEVIALMGSKTTAKAIMASAGVPTLPSVEVPTGTGSRFDPSEAEHLPLPLLVKAAFGGGGRGMRIVTSFEDLADSVRLASHEAASAFGDGTVFIEPLMIDPHHIEVQIIGDTHGNYGHLFERECSIQRRYQKIVEESPSPTITSALRQQLTDAAVAAARAISYVGVGTVEFIATNEGSFYFLEVNTRLQVEHGVTELVAGVDLVRAQLLIARGEELPREIQNATQRGHAIEVRLYAEDPSDQYRPQAGVLSNFTLAQEPGVRIDQGYSSGNSVSPYYDAMLAKILSWGETRDEAIERLKSALRKSVISGVATNLSLFSAICDEDEFVRGVIDTGYLERHDPAALIASQRPSPEERSRLLIAATVGRVQQLLGQRRVQRSIPFGWRNVVTADPQCIFVGDDSERDVVTYRFVGLDTLSCVHNDEQFSVVVLAVADAALRLEINGHTTTYTVLFDDDRVTVSDARHQMTWRLAPRFRLVEHTLPLGSLVAPMPSTVVSIATHENDQVERGTTLVTVEAMKMHYDVVAPTDGRVRKILVDLGDQLKAGDIVIDFDSTDDKDAT